MKAKNEDSLFLKAIYTVKLLDSFVLEILFGFLSFQPWGENRNIWIRWLVGERWIVLQLKKICTKVA